jgi:hypothetical protein
MSNLPITSRIKRSPLQKQVTNSIDPNNPSATVGGIFQEPDQTVTTLGESKYNYTGPLDTSGNYYEKLAKEEGFKNFKGTIKNEYEQSKLKKMSEAGNSNVEEEKGESSTTVVPGATTTWEGTLKKATTGDVMQPWEVRQMSRSIKKEQRDIRRSKIKASKFGSQNDKGEWVAKENLSPRQQAKFDEATAEFKAFQAAATRNEAARGSGKKGGTIGVDTGQTDMLQSDLGKKEQETMLAEAAARKAGVITAEKEKQKKISEEGEAGMAADDEARKNKTGIYAPKDPSPAEMKPSAFKMYAKSPAAKKLQGAQNTLPQHLQDAIKAAPESPAKLGPLAAIAGKALIGAAINKLASSNKMRSGFKMKGYGKK